MMITLKPIKIQAHFQMKIYFCRPQFAWAQVVSILQTDGQSSFTHAMGGSRSSPPPSQQKDPRRAKRILDYASATTITIQKAKRVLAKITIPPNPKKCKKTSIINVCDV